MFVYVCYVVFNLEINCQRAGIVCVKFPLTLHHPHGDFFQQNLRCAYYVLHTTLGSGDIAIKHTKKPPALVISRLVDNAEKT